MEPTESQGPYQPRTPPMSEDDPVVQWLLQGDPAIRWQVLHDLIDASETEVATERARVEHEGWGARLLALRAHDGQWANGACFPDTAAFAADTARALAAGKPPPPWPSPDAEPAEAPTDGSGAEPGQPWTATYRVLLDLCDLGAPPGSPVMQETAHLVARNCLWEYDGRPFFAGEVDCCINAGTILIGAYLGVDVDPVVQRLVADQMPDGGWNCWAEKRPAPSSFASTLDVIDALLRWERRTGGSEEVRRTRRDGEEYLLRRHLFRSLRTGEVVNPEWTLFSYPPRWHYDVLKATEYFARRGGTPDPRLAEAIERIRAKRRSDGRWLLENTHPGAVHFRFEEPDGTPSRWNTLRALRVLRWYDASAPSGSAPAVRLRRVDDHDLDVFFEHQADPQAVEMAAFPARDKDQFAAHWAKIRADETLVARTIVADGMVAGNIGSWPENGQQLLGYWVGREWWGRGVATQALALLVDEVSIRPLYAHVSVHNVGSIRVLEKCGFRRDRVQEAKAPAADDGIEEFIFVLDA